MKIINIKILNRIELFKELKDCFNFPSNIALGMLNQMERMENDDFLQFSNDIMYLNSSKNISFDIIEEPELAEYSVSDRSFLNDNNKFENKLGLTQSEMWFNTLSDEEKEYVRELAYNNFSMVATG